MLGVSLRRMANFNLEAYDFAYDWSFCATFSVATWPLNIHIASQHTILSLGTSLCFLPVGESETGQTSETRWLRYSFTQKDKPRDWISATLHPAVYCSLLPHGSHYLCSLSAFISHCEIDGQSRRHLQVLNQIQQKWQMITNASL